jgi:hypothetical protein
MLTFCSRGCVALKLLLLFAASLPSVAVCKPNLRTACMQQPARTKLSITHVPSDVLHSAPSCK